MNALDRATLDWVNAPTPRERDDAIIRIARVQNERLAESERLAAEYRERYVPGGDGPDPCPDEWQPEDHEPEAPTARPGAMQDWVGEI